MEYKKLPRRIRMTPVLAAEFVDLLHVFINQIDGDPRAVQFFDFRLIKRARAALAKAEGRDL